MQTHLNHARELLSQGSYTCVLCRDSLVYTDTRRGIRQVYAPVISQPAAAVLEEHGILVQYETSVPAIRNRDQSGLCPMETAVRDISDPAEALSAIRSALAALQK